MSTSKSTRARKAPSADSVIVQPSVPETRLKVDALCKLLKQKARCLPGAYAAGEAAGELYLEILRSRDTEDGWKIVDLHGVVEAICANPWHTHMLFGFACALHWPLYLGTRAVTPSEPKDMEQLMRAVRAGLEKTQRESDREFNRDKSKRGWETRRRRASSAGTQARP